jgi:uncharacterized protein YukE
MADIQLNHETVNQAVDEMNQTAQQMESAVEDLINQLTPLSTSFQGAAAVAFNDISANRQKIYDDLTATFSNGAGVLGNMHQELIAGDRRGASMLGG